MAGKKNKEENFKYLVIVESPAKSKTLTKILGDNYLVKSSVGHIRDLPAKGLGIDVKKDFEPEYEIMSGKQKIVDELNSFAQKAEKVLLASDPDREGEAIAWHLSKILHCKKNNISRVSFNQITPDAVRNAVANPREIDKHLVEAQQARRILDRLVGYKISPLLWRKIGGRSAGRVQSIAVRLICEREEEIRAFKPEEYWSVFADVYESKSSADGSFSVRLTHIDSKRVSAPTKELDENKTLVIKSQDEVNKIIDRIEKSKLKVNNLSSKPGTQKPKAPFKTSTLQRAASNALGFSVKKTMQIAQELYEGVKLGNEDQVGLITYMRTDSLRLAPEAIEMAKNYIINKWGADYYPEELNEYDKKSKKDKQKEQDAHEAIRPTYADKNPISIKKYLSDDQYKLYKLIWERFISCQMTAKRTETSTLEICSESGDLVFKASQTKTLFPGYAIVYGDHAEISEDLEDEEQDSKFPTNVKIGDPISVHETHTNQHFTEGPPRYNEASLVKTLEELGIGRPSTYAPTIATIVDRKYVEKINGNALIPTKLGITVNKLLVEHFSKFINVDFTSKMEGELDEVAEDRMKWQDMLKDFYYGEHAEKIAKQVKEAKKKIKENKDKDAKDPLLDISPDDLGFADTVKRASLEIDNVVITTEHKCPKCGALMNLKSSRFGPFLGCSRYPDCDGIVNLTKEGKPAPADRPYTEEACPDCKQNSLVIRYGRYGDYIACTTDKCGYSAPLLKKTGVKCPKPGCRGDIVEKKSRFGKIFYGCSSWSQTKCDAVFWYPPIDEKCPQCGLQMMYKSLKRGDKIACSDTKNCGFNRPASPQEQERYRSLLSKQQGTESEKSVFSI
jgi:DNA topoisomerase-1